MLRIKLWLYATALIGVLLTSGNSWAQESQPAEPSSAAEAKKDEPAAPEKKEDTETVDSDFIEEGGTSYHIKLRAIEERVNQLKEKILDQELILFSKLININLNVNCNMRY